MACSVYIGCTRSTLGVEAKHEWCNVRRTAKKKETHRKSVLVSNELAMISHAYLMCGERNAHLNFKIQMRANATVVRVRTLRSSPFIEF